MELKKISLSKIKPYEKNARKNDEAVEYVIKSIQQCEYIAPIIIDENNVILAGHTRYKALKKLGYKEAECVVKEGLTEEQKKKYRLLDNKTAEFAEWDFELLESELSGLDFGDLEIDWGIPDKENENDFDIEDGYYGDERERTYSSYNLEAYDSERTVGFYQLPTLKAESFVPTELIGFNYAKTSDNKKTGIHFFIDDYQFERVWNAPLEYVDILRQYECVLTPDFSLYRDMPMAMKIWNVYRARLIGQIMQDSGIKVIPTLTWAEKETFSFCFDGIEQGGTVATSTVGVMRDKEAKKIWCEGMQEAIKKIKPKNILLYGSKIDFDFGDINVKYFESRKFGG